MGGLVTVLNKQWCAGLLTILELYFGFFNSVFESCPNKDMFEHHLDQPDMWTNRQKWI